MHYFYSLKIFPQETRYYEYFLRQWEYVQSFIIDSIDGDWFEGGIDKEPNFRTGPQKSYVEMYVSYRAHFDELHYYPSRRCHERDEQIYQLLA